MNLAVKISKMDLVHWPSAEITDIKPDRYWHATVYCRDTRYIIAGRVLPCLDDEELSQLLDSLVELYGSQIDIAIDIPEAAVASAFRWAKAKGVHLWLANGQHIRAPSSYLH